MVAERAMNTTKLKFSHTVLPVLTNFNGLQIEQQLLTVQIAFNTPPDHIAETSQSLSATVPHVGVLQSQIIVASGPPLPPPKLTMLGSCPFPNFNK